MKTEVVESKSVKENQFPLIARSINDKILVLFVSSNEGTVLVRGEGNKVIGEYNQKWASCFDSDRWEILREVTITFKSE
jgi:hypothetical protein